MAANGTNNRSEKIARAIATLGKTRLVASAIALVGFITLSIITKADLSFAFETDLILWLQAAVTGGWGRLLSLAYYAGDTESAGVVTAIVLIYLFIKRWWQEGLWFAVATAGALIWVGEVFKPLFDKARPPFFDDPSIHGAAFPSGHTTGNSILYFFIAYLLTCQRPEWGVRSHIITVLWLIVMGFGSLRVGAHWPTDILGGYCLGVLWLMVCLSFLKASPYLPWVHKLPHMKLPHMKQYK
ncbi:MAG: phosphatase PAP2 family protein [Cyanobacteria bacterium J06597_16]